MGFGHSMIRGDFRGGGRKMEFMPGSLQSAGSDVFFVDGEFCKGDDDGRQVLQYPYRLKQLIHHIYHHGTSLNSVIRRSIIVV